MQNGNADYKCSAESRQQTRKIATNSPIPRATTARVLKSMLYNQKSLKSNNGPKTSAASLAAKGNVRKVATMKASVVLQMESSERRIMSAAMATGGLVANGRMTSCLTAVLNVAATTAPKMRKKVTSRKSAVADWTARSSGFAEGAGAENGGSGQLLDDEADDRRDGKTEGEPQDGHFPRTLPLESREGAESDDGADDGRGQHVSHRAGKRQALFEKAPDDDHAAAFAHGEDEPEQAAQENRGGFIFRQQPGDAFGGDEDIDKTGNERAEQEEGNALKKNAEKGDGEVVEVKREPGHVKGESPRGAESWEKSALR